MAQERRDRVKDLIFFTFLAISVVLVLLVWVDGLRPDADAVPGYYRSSTPSGDNAASTIPAATPPAPETGATGEAPGEQPGSDGRESPTSTPTGRNLDGEEM